MYKKIAPYNHSFIAYLQCALVGDNAPILWTQHHCLHLWLIVYACHTVKLFLTGG